MNQKAHWRRGMKALHEIAGIGVGGGLVTCLVINLTSSHASGAALVSARESIAAIARYVLIPSLALVLITGLVAIALTRGFHEAGWAWLKAALGLSVFEATLVTVGASSTQVELAQAASDPTLLASMLHSERNTLLLLIGLCIANVVLAVWRPKLTITIR